MKESKVVYVNGQPRLSVDGKNYPLCAYVTYFAERNRYEDFKKAGYNLFSVTVGLSTRPINDKTGFTPYEKGIFDDVEHPNYDVLDTEVKRILSVCPDALIFPRIYITMPQKWCDKNPSETIETVLGEKREMLFSESFRRDGAELMRRLIIHINSSDYAENIIGYHLAGGGTEEWFHFNRQAGVCKNAEKYFAKYMKENYPEEKFDGKMPDISELMGTGEITSPTVSRYLEFSNREVAKTALHFAKTAKEAVNYRQVVGVFFGYNIEINSGFPGDCATEMLINEKAIDFFCSPNSYMNTRSLGIDWGDSMPAASIRNAGKVCLLENDIRTSLSDFINNCRPGADKNNMYYGAIWLGPKTVRESIGAIRKSFARQHCYGNGFWWFDMWGGWYNHPKYMREMKLMRRLSETLDGAKHSYRPETALVCDSLIYTRLKNESEPMYATSAFRRAIGNSGVPYDSYILENFNDNYLKYKMVFFSVPSPTKELQEAVELCKMAGISYVVFTPEKYAFTSAEVRSLCKKAGAFVFCDTDDVVYCGNGLLAVHAATAGVKEIKLPKLSRVKRAGSKEKFTECRKIEVNIAKHGTEMFIVEDVDCKK